MNENISKQIYDTMVSHQFVVSIMGNIDQELLLSLLKITDTKLTKMEVDQTMKKKIFHFMIECAQNLSRIDKPTESNNNIFLIGKRNDDYIVHIGGYIKNAEIEKISTVISQVNNIDTEELKSSYYKELTDNELANMNSLLISLLSISKKLKEKINHEISPVDSENSFLSFKSIISNIKLTDGIYN